MACICPDRSRTQGVRTRRPAPLPRRDARPREGPGVPCPQGEFAVASVQADHRECGQAASPGPQPLNPDHYDDGYIRSLNTAPADLTCAAGVAIRFNEADRPMTFGQHGPTAS